MWETRQFILKKKKKYKDDILIILFFLNYLLNKAYQLKIKSTFDNLALSNDQILHV